MHPSIYQTLESAPLVLLWAEWVWVSFDGFNFQLERCWLLWDGEVQGERLESGSPQDSDLTTKRSVVRPSAISETHGCTWWFEHPKVMVHSTSVFTIDSVVYTTRVTLCAYSSSVKNVIFLRSRHALTPSICFVKLHFWATQWCSCPSQNQLFIDQSTSTQV